MKLLASFGMPREWILIYAWHPLAVWEFAGSGHVDPLAFAFIALALLARRRNWEAATGVALGMATLQFGNGKEQSFTKGFTSLSKEPEAAREQISH